MFTEKPNRKKTQRNYYSTTIFNLGINLGRQERVFLTKLIRGERQLKRQRRKINYREAKI